MDGGHVADAPLPSLPYALVYFGLESGGQSGGPSAACRRSAPSARRNLRRRLRAAPRSFRRTSNSRSSPRPSRRRRRRRRARRLRLGVRVAGGLGGCGAHAQQPGDDRCRDARHRDLQSLKWLARSKRPAAMMVPGRIATLRHWRSGRMLGQARSIGGFARQAIVKGALHDHRPHPPHAAPPRRRLLAVRGGASPRRRPRARRAAGRPSPTGRRCGSAW